MKTGSVALLVAGTMMSIGVIYSDWISILLGILSGVIGLLLRWNIILNS